MGIEQAYLLVKELHEQATGRKVLTAVDGSNFISVAQATLQAGTEPLLNAISTVLTKSLIAVRGYNSKFGGLEYSADRWGGITRKINFADTDQLRQLGYRGVHRMFGKVARQLKEKMR